MQIHPYGLALTLAFALGTALALRRAKRAGIDPQKVTSAIILIIVATVIGARLTYVAVNYGEFADDPWKIINPYQGGVLRLNGMVVNGGLVLSIGVLVAYLLWNRMPVLKTMDAMAPSMALGECLVRLGCFFNGCCWGKPTSLPWGVYFPVGSPAGNYQSALSPHSAIHPTQLYSSFYALGIFVLLLILERRFKRFDGFTVFSFLFLYGVARFTVEFFRYYSNQTGVWLGLTHNQYLSVVLCLVSAAALWRLSRAQTVPQTAA